MVQKRSKRYRACAEGVDTKIPHSIDDAVKVLKGGKAAKFDETFEIAIKLNIDPTQADQLIRGAYSLPNGTGKKLRVIAFAEGDAAEAAREAGAVEVGGEELVKKITDGWFDFDVAIAHPATMRFVGRLGRVLGPKGMMPSPKSGTVTPNVAQAVAEFSGGKIEFRNDKFGNIHVPVGRMSFEDDKLVENISAFVEYIKAMRPLSIKGTFMTKTTLTTTMGLGLVLDL